MKKVYLLFSGALLASAGYAQLTNTVKMSAAQPVMEIADRADVTTVFTRPGATEDRAGGDVVWSDGFDDAANWIIEGPAGADETHNWLIGTEETWFFDGADVITSTGGGDYAVCKNGDPQVGGDPLPGGEFIMTYDGSVDLTGLTSVLFQFEQYGAKFNDDQFVEISDDGSTWYVLGSNLERPGLFLGAGGSYQNAELMQFNLSQTIADEGLDASTITVRFRLTWGDAVAGPGITYGWFVDDVAMIEAYDYDLSLNETYIAAGEWPVAVSRMPVSQATDVTFSAKMWNGGTLDLTNAVFRAEIASEGYNETSTGVTASPGVVDSVVVETVFAAPTSTGTLNVDYSVGADETLENTFNDEQGTTLRMTEDIMSADYYYGAQADITGSFFGWGAPTGFSSSIGNVVEIFEDGVIGGIEAGLRDYSNSESSEGRLLFALIYKFNEDAGEFEFEFQSTDYVVESGDVGDVAEIIFEEGLEVTAGEIYLVTAGSYNGDDSRVAIMTAGTSPIGTVFGTDGDNVVQLVNAEGSEEVTVITPVVRAIFKDFTGLETETVNTFSIGQNSPNPFGDNAVINYELSEAANVSVEFMDVSGKVVKSINNGTQDAGVYTLEVDAQDFAEGVYFYTFTVGNEKVTKRMVITK